MTMRFSLAQEKKCVTNLVVTMFDWKRMHTSGPVRYRTIKLSSASICEGLMLTEADPRLLPPRLGLSAYRPELTILGDLYVVR